MTASPATSARGNPRVKKRWFAYFGLNSLGLSILLHVLFGVGATFLIVEQFQKKHVNFHATEPPAPHTDVEHKVELSKRNNVESAPPDLKRIVSTDVSAITLPDPPEVPTTDEPDPTPIAAVDGVMGSAISEANGNGGSGNGGGGGSGDGSGMTMYGAPDGAGFRGSLYDLKQTPDGHPTEMAESEAEKQIGPDHCDPGCPTSPQTLAEIAFVSKFVHSWEPELLNKYYKAPENLFLPQIYIPIAASSKATKAFHVDDKVVARRWIAIYRATIIPPESGTFRFVGCADDFMVVRIGDQNVLDACVDYETADPKARTGEDVGIGFENLPLQAGPWFTLDQDTPVKMKVLIGEGGGGQSGFILMIQKQGVNYQKGDDPVFQLRNVNVPPDPFRPNFSGRRMLFQASTDDDDNDNDQ